MKWFIAIVFIAVIISMGSALFYMMRDDRDSENDQRAQRMLISLAVRVGLCIFLFLSILVAWRLGLISPTGIPAGA